MSRPFIVLGDQTDHGGVVVGAAGTTDTHGKRIARVGDQVTCPKKGHGTTVIVTGDPTMIIDGQPAARHGDKCACGATLISSQAVSTTADGGTSNPQAASAAQAAKAAAHIQMASAPRMHMDEASGLFALSYDQFFVLTDELTGMPLAKQPYRLTCNGAVSEGITNDQGHTAVLPTGTSPDEVTCEILGDASHG
jgi:uncharacterized Zn-binding protein involved in type VI secretion